MKIILAKRLTKSEKIQIESQMQLDWNAPVVGFCKDSIAYYVETQDFLAVILKIKCDCRDTFVVASPSYGHFIQCPYCEQLHEVSQEIYEESGIPELYISYN